MIADNVTQVESAEGTVGLIVRLNGHVVATVVCDHRIAQELGTTLDQWAESTAGKFPHIWQHPPETH